MPKHTPFHSRTSVLCEGSSWVDWSGFLSASSYELDHLHEYNAIRTSAALFDVSPLFKYDVRGPGALAMLNRVVTRDLSKCRVGQVVYTGWCDDAGKIIDDGTVARLGENSFRMTAAVPTMYWLEDNQIGLDVEIEDVSEAFGALALQGPTSRDLLQTLVDGDLSQLKYFHTIEQKVAGVPARIARTGYTGDLGYEIFVRPDGAEELWDALMETGKSYAIYPSGMTALEMVRIEAGLLLIDVDFISTKQTLFDVQRSSPYELGLGWTVKLDKDYFVGRDALRAEKARGPAWSTVGLEIDVVALEKIFAKFSMPLHLPYTAWNDEIPIYRDAGQRQHVGKATSGTWSPILKKYIVIARIKPQDSALGSRVFMEVGVEGHRFAVPATVVKMPFYDPPRKKG
jgi:aminomethyltransferase